MAALGSFRKLATGRPPVGMIAVAAGVIPRTPHLSVARDYKRSLSTVVRTVLLTLLRFASLRWVRLTKRDDVAKEFIIALNQATVGMVQNVRAATVL